MEDRLKTLMEQALDAARKIILTDNQEVEPMYLVETGAGHVGFVQTPRWGTMEEREFILSFLQQLFAELGAVRYVSVNEGWMVQAHGKQAMEAGTQAARRRALHEHPDRVEVLTVTGAERRGDQTRALALHCRLGKTEARRTCGEPEWMGEEWAHKGALSQLLPEHPAQPSLEKAQAIAKRFGFTLH